MGTLKEDIKTQSEWITKAFLVDGHTLDYSITSTKEIDLFFSNNMKNNRPIKGGRLDNQGYGSILFSIGSYIGETINKNIRGSEWITDDNDPKGELNVTIQLPDGTLTWPVKRVMKRFHNGEEDSIYPYVHVLTKKYPKEDNDSRNSENQEKPWWKKW